MKPPGSLALASPPGGRLRTARQSRFRGGKLGDAVTLAVTLPVTRNALAVSALRY